MAKRKDAVTMTELRKNAARVLKRAAGSRRAIVVTKRGEACGLLLGAKASAEHELMRSLLEGERDIAAGRVRSADAVIADARKVLRRHQR